MDDRRQSPSGKMFTGRSTRRTTRSGASSAGFWGALKPLELEVASGIKQAFSVPKPSEWVIESSTPSTSGCPSSDGGFSSLPCRTSLSNILEREPVHPKYFLSAKACSGALQRAEKRGKKLPKVLRDALLAVVQGAGRHDSSQEPATACPAATTPKVATSRPRPPTPRPLTAVRPARPQPPKPPAPRAIPTPKPSSNARSSL